MEISAITYAIVIQHSNAIKQWNKYGKSAATASISMITTAI